MVIAADRARTNQIRASLGRLRDSDAHLVGALLTRVEKSGDEYGYNYNYSYSNDRETSKNGGFAKKRRKAGKEARSINMSAK